jgi:23S rRNA (guanine745-N1)-methyltransferase
MSQLASGSSRPNFICPVCSLPLDLRVGSYICANQHAYDLAREGYVNLLLSQHKRSREPGDSGEMIHNRQRFLEKGYYRGLAEAIAHQVYSLPRTDTRRVLDIGCGEGYYLQHLRAAASLGAAPLELAGIDISKPAVRLAAKRTLNAVLAVASAYAIPFADGAFDTALSVFSPVDAGETARILAPGGRIIMVGPGGQHLRGLVSHIYDRALPHQGNYQALDAAPQFKLVDQFELKQTTTIAGEDILPLLTMTPYYWHTRPEQKDRLSALDQLETPLHFIVKTYEKAALPARS